VATLQQTGGPALGSPPANGAVAPGPGVAAGGPGAPGPARGRRARGLVPATAPGKLQLFLAVLVVLSAAWGGVGAWTVSQHASAAADIVSASEPLTLDAQQMYQSLADADVTVTTAFLSGPDESLGARDRYQADIAQAATDLSALKQAAGGNQQLDASLAAISAGLPVYTGYVAQAQADYSLGFPLTGGSFMQVASEEMHLTLLPAARSSYLQENARLSAASARATELPWIIVVVGLAVVTAFVLYWAQRWLRRHTHRIVNYGLLGASAVLVVGMLWLIVAFAIARGDLHRGVGQGAAPAETLAQASIAVQQARGDELLNLISRSGDTSFEQNFDVVRRELGPGPGTLLTSAAASSGGGPGARPAAAAARDAQAWYVSNEQVYQLDVAANYAAETQLVIGTGPGSSAAGFRTLEADLGQAIAADQVTFTSSANAGAGAFGGLEAGVIAACVLMAAGCAWGLSRRLAEYR
jgi:hypothetical protein